MKQLLTITIAMVSLSLWSQTTPPLPSSSGGQFSTNFFGTNGLFTGNNALVLRDLQANVEQLRSLLTLLETTATDGSVNNGGVNAGTLPGANVNQAGQNFGRANGVNFSGQDGRNFSQSAAVTPGAPTRGFVSQASVSPTVSGGFGALGASTQFGSGNGAGTTGTPFTLVEIQLINNIQANLQALQFNAQQLIPILGQASGALATEFATNGGFGVLTNSFAPPLTNAFGQPLTNFGAPLSNTFGSFNRQPDEFQPAGASVGGNTVSPGSPSTGVGTGPQSPSTGGGAFSQSPSTGVGASAASPSTGLGGVGGSPSTGVGGSVGSPSTGLGGGGASSPSTGGGRGR